MDKKKIAKIVGIVILVLLVLSFGWNILGIQSRRGVAFIKQEEKKDLSKIEKNINEIQKKEAQEAIANGKYNIYGLLGNYVFYGDSRVLHYAEYGFADESRIFAANGMTYKDVPTFDADLKSINPDNIFLAYGINDIYYHADSGYENGFEGLMDESIQHIIDICPNAHIYVLGVITASPFGWAYLKLEDTTPEYNEIQKKVCDKYDQVTYIDDEVLSEDGSADIYASDGYHFIKDFYPVWTDYIAQGMK